MPTESSLKTFIWAIIVGMGFHIGWGLISLLISLAARAVNIPGPQG